MQVLGRLSPVLGDTLSMVLFNEYISGHVWVEGGQVIGNVTLQSIDQAGSRWRLSNVAVLPAYRRRGIARALMLASLREIAQRQGHWAVLQVRADNSAAHDLYLNLGFSDVARDAVYRRTMLPARLPDPDIPLQQLGIGTGAEIRQLAQAARTPLAQWAEPIRGSEYQTGLGRAVGEWLGNWTGLHRVERWGAWQNRELMGAVETRTSVVNDFSTMRFMVRPVARGSLERALVAQGLKVLTRTGSTPVLVEHDGEHEEGTAALRSVGFRVQRDLITMRRAVMPQDIEL